RQFRMEKAWEFLPRRPRGRGGKQPSQRRGRPPSPNGVSRRRPGNPLPKAGPLTRRAAVRQSEPAAQFSLPGAGAMPEPKPAAAADRNLLFGVLALQLDFISRDALVAAMNAWVLDKAKPLGQILLEQGALRPDALSLLDAL